MGYGDSTEYIRTGMRLAIYKIVSIGRCELDNGNEGACHETATSRGKGHLLRLGIDILRLRSMSGH